MPTRQLVLRRTKQLYLPDNLGHIQRLRNSKLKDGSDSLEVFNSAFDLCPLNPSRAERGVVLRGQLHLLRRCMKAYRQELLIKRPDPIEFSQSHFKLDIASEQLGFGAHSDTDTEDFTCCSYVLSSDLEIGIREPQLDISEAQRR